MLGWVDQTSRVEREGQIAGPEILADVYQRIFKVLEKALEGLSRDDLNYLPNPDSNSMGWLTWHLTRWQDRSISDLMGEQQLWVKDGWHEKFGRPADAADTGNGHTQQQVAAFSSPDASTLLAYHQPSVGSPFGPSS